MTRREGLRLGRDDVRIRRRQREPLATVPQTAQVAVPKAGPAVDDGDRLEQAVAVLQAAVGGRDGVAGPAVDECRQPVNGVNTRLPLVPPKPNEFDTAARIFISRAVCGT